MSFRDINKIEVEYKTLRNNVVKDFYLPCLNEAIVYKRAVGFFSSTILLQISQGLGAFADHHGKMKLIVSPKLDKEDYEAIKKGYEVKKCVSEKIYKDFDFDIDFSQKNERFEMLSNMISSNLLEIKIVVLNQDNNIAMYHEKIGIFKDDLGNTISFSGSANETENGYYNNYESFDIFCSWQNEDLNQRCYLKEKNFDKIRNGDEEGLITIPFPDAIKNKLLKYKSFNGKTYAELDEDLRLFFEANNKVNENNPFVSENISLYAYQNEAIETWANNNYCGIFDMATGTGKTFTAGGAICKLFDDKKRCFVIICCPYIHLIDQWYDELKSFNISAIKCYGSSKYGKSLEREVTKFRQKRTNFSCILITNGSFQKTTNQDLFKTNLEDTLLIVDEAHNFGAEEIGKTLSTNFKYRLALSATFDRYADEEGTQKLYDFFGKKCISYTLEKALLDGRLTPYKYYPILVNLTEEEQDDYITISKEISKIYNYKDKKSERLKSLLIRRARIISGASNKIIALRNILEKYKKQHNMLIYCGAVVNGKSNQNFKENEEKQIDAVLSLLNNELNIRSTKFTSEENSSERCDIINAFTQQDIQALVAIKCLDEGLNVPGIKTAFILASTTNPKEYIQRRGRVLRLSAGKQYAEIYDFITLFKPLDDVSIYNVNFAIEKNLARKEMNRMDEFASLSNNPSDSNELITAIKNAYNMNIIIESEETYE
ncbi:MAG: DEAD/DEAH box helicase family protein [Bacilli bacterium]